MILKGMMEDMTPPFLSYVTFNRLGLTARNLQSLLNTPEDFEMHIIDSNSKDDTWEYIQDLKDPRIKSKTQLPLNAGPIYALNFNMARRRPDQYFLTVDNDVHIKTPDWISKFMTVFNTFPEVGVLGVMRAAPYLPIYPEVVTKTRNGVTYQELKNGHVDVILDFVHGCCQMLRPELISQIGYWSEECGWGDAELSPRVMNYTNYKVGFMSDENKNSLIDIDMTQTIDCNSCTVQQYCKLDKYNTTCFSLRNKVYKNEPFVSLYKWKYLEVFKELAEGKRTAYCASILDPQSMINHYYNKEWALENFSYYIENGN